MSTVAHKGHYTLFHNILRIIKYASQIMHNTSIDAMFCSTRGEFLQVLFKFCLKCGKDLANNKEITVRDETSGKKTLSFKEFKVTK